MDSNADGGGVRAPRGSFKRLLAAGVPTELVNELNGLVRQVKETINPNATDFYENSNRLTFADRLCSETNPIPLFAIAYSPMAARIFNACQGICAMNMPVVAESVEKFWDIAKAVGWQRLEAVEHCHGRESFSLMGHVHQIRKSLDKRPENAEDIVRQLANLIRRQLDLFAYLVNHEVSGWINYRTCLTNAPALDGGRG